MPARARSLALRFCPCIILRLYLHQPPQPTRTPAAPPPLLDQLRSTTPATGQGKMPRAGQKQLALAVPAMEEQEAHARRCLGSGVDFPCSD
jgi:hypothetical protein